MTSPLVPVEKSSLWHRHGRAIRLGLSLILLGNAIYSLHWQNLLEALPTIDWQWVFVSLVILWLSNAISGMRWSALMQACGFQHGKWSYIRLYFAGGLINQGLPTILGGDSYRAYQAHRSLNPSGLHPTPMANGILGVLLDRSLGFAGNSILGAIGLAMGGAVLGQWAMPIGKVLLIIMILGVILLGILLQWKTSQQFYLKMLHRLGIRVGLQPSQLAWGLRFTWWQIPLAVLIHVLTLAAFWACLMACHVQAPLESLFIGIPALGLLMILPISVSGWGLRETSLASILGLWGLDSTLVILSSIVYGLTILITFLPGLPRLIQKD